LPPGRFGPGRTGRRNERRLVAEVVDRSEQVGGLYDRPVVKNFHLGGGKVDLDVDHALDPADAFFQLCGAIAAVQAIEVETAVNPVRVLGDGRRLLSRGRRFCRVAAVAAHDCRRAAATVVANRDKLFFCHDYTSSDVLYVRCPGTAAA
jgi:hypothetical protein